MATRNYGISSIWSWITGSRMVLTMNRLSLSGLTTALPMEYRPQTRNPFRRSFVLQINPGSNKWAGWPASSRQAASMVTTMRNLSKVSKKR